MYRLDSNSQLLLLYIITLCPSAVQWLFTACVQKFLFPHLYLSHDDPLRRCSVENNSFILHAADHMDYPPLLIPNRYPKKFNSIHPFRRNSPAKFHPSYITAGHAGFPPLPISYSLCEFVFIPSNPYIPYNPCILFRLQNIHPSYITAGHAGYPPLPISYPLSEFVFIPSDPYIPYNPCILFQL